MADTRRRTAADARRVSERAAAGKVDTDEMRSLLRRMHARGVEDGREQMQQEMAGLDVRHTLLDIGREVMDLFAARVSGVPNSHRTGQAFREAGALLTDARRQGEPATSEPDPTDPDAVEDKPGDAEEKPKPKPRSKAKTTRKKA